MSVLPRVPGLTKKIFCSGCVQAVSMAKISVSDATTVTGQLLSASLRAVITIKASASAAACKTGRENVHAANEP